MELGGKIASSTGLNKFLVEVAPLHKRLRFSDQEAEFISPRCTTGRPSGLKIPANQLICGFSTGISLTNPPSFPTKLVHRANYPVPTFTYLGCSDYYNW